MNLSVAQTTPSSTPSEGAVPSVEQKQVPDLWSRCSKVCWHTLAYIPDVWCVVAHTGSLLENHLNLVPSALKTVRTALGLISSFCLGEGYKSFLNEIFRAFPKSFFRSGAFSGALGVAYIAAILGGTLALVSDGIQDVLNRFNIPIPKLLVWLDKTGPLITLFLRFSIYLQLSNLEDSRALMERLDGALKSPNGDRKALEVIQNDLWVYKKVIGTKSNIREVVKKALASQNTGKGRECVELYRKCYNRYTKYQVIGLGANVFAASSALSAVSSAAMPIFGLLSSLAYIYQTYWSFYSTDEVKKELIPLGASAR